MKTTRRLLPLALALAALMAVGTGCKRKKHAARSDAAQPCAVVGALAFAAACTGDCECASGLCGEFGDGTRACTLKCQDASVCPPGSRGKKCSQQAFCRP